MNPKLKEILKLLSVPLILMAVYVLMYILWRVLHLPTDDQMISVVKHWFEAYGLWIVFGSALVEGFLLLGQYFPGGFIIFLGVISAGKDIGRATEVVSVVSLAFFIAYTMNYLVGKHGWYRLLVRFGLSNSIEKSKEKLLKHGFNTVFFSYWEPNLASLTATAAGILHMSLKKFSVYSAAGIILWNIFWGALVYSLGESALKITGLKYVFIIFLLWVGIILVRKFVFDKNSKNVSV